MRRLSRASLVFAGVPECVALALPEVEVEEFEAGLPAEPEGAPPVTKKGEKYIIVHDREKETLRCYSRLAHCCCCNASAACKS
jgi:hypothetical protein